MNFEPDRNDFPDEEPFDGEEFPFGSDDTASPDELKSLQEQLEATGRAERDENRDLALRATADLENYRRRANREREEDAKYRVLSIAAELLPVVDNLERAVLAAKETGNSNDLIQGVEMVLNQLESVLRSHRVEKIPTAGETFDPNRHEALSQVPTDEHPPFAILQEVQPGYTLHERVLRPSKVIVAMAPPNTK